MPGQAWKKRKRKRERRRERGKKGDGGRGKGGGQGVSEQNVEKKNGKQKERESGRTTEQGKYNSEHHARTPMFIRDKCTYIQKRVFTRV